MLPEFKVCIDCKKEKPIEDFWLRRDRKYGMSVCKICNGLRVKAWRHTPEGKLARKKYNLSKNFGMTLEDWDTLYFQQDGKCAICERDFSQIGKTPSVDHDHKTGRIRGLLCPVCNQWLGLVQDNPWLAVYYILPDLDIPQRIKEPALAVV